MSTRTPVSKKSAVSHSKNIQAKADSTVPQPAERVTLGVVLSLGAVAIGIALWVLLWSKGFMASFVPFIMAVLAVKFYQKGAGFISRSSSIYLMVLIVVGTILAFLSGMASDMLTYYLAEVRPQPTLAALASRDFWDMFTYNIFTNGALWGTYMTDVLIAVAFAGLGIYSVMKDLLTGFFLPTQPTVSVAATK
jgi:hypothetical protein